MLIPDNIEEFNSVGEKILYLKFKHDGSADAMIVLHSVFTNHHLKNMSGELDFLVLAPNQGFFTIEVKHGAVSRNKGQWCYTNKWGKTECTTTGPFVQQSHTMNSLRKYVINKVKHNRELEERFKKILWGSGVAFTSMTEFIDFGPEGHSYQVLTRLGLQQMAIGEYINVLSKGSHKEHSNKPFYDVNASRPTRKDCETLVNILRGDFEINYTEVNRIADCEALIEAYTREQFSLLDFINYNPRCLIEGSAGTGKTLMAIEITARKSREHTIGMFCFNTLLGEKLASLTQAFLSGNTKSFCGSFHKYLTNNSGASFPVQSGNEEKYFTEDLPIDFLIRNEYMDENDKFDFLVLDEAQDLLSPYYMEVFDLILKGGLKNGNWVMFGDFSNQAIFLNESGDIFRRMNEATTYTRFPPLRINCRNTKMIATQNTLLTGVEMPLFKSDFNDGRKVEFRYTSEADEVAVIEKILLDIECRGIPLNKVTLLSPRKTENRKPEESVQVKRMITKGVQTSTIQAFKGLENTIVILFGFDEVTSSRMQRLLYVGISRARQELYLVLDRSRKQAVAKLMKDNIIGLN